MTTFLRLLAEPDKAAALQSACQALRQGAHDARLFEVAPDAFDAVPGKPFAYWVSEAVRQTFQRLPRFESDGRTVKQGLATADDFRFVRAWWEVSAGGTAWFPFAKGGAYSPFYADVYLLVNWRGDGAEIKAGICQRYPYLNGNPDYVAKNTDHYLRPGLTWPRRTNGLSFRVMPRGCIFADKGPAAFVADDAPDALLALCAVLNSQAFGLLVSVQLARVELAQSFEVGLIQQTPIPHLEPRQQAQLAALGRRAWSLKRTLDTVEETSHAFLLPAVLRGRLGDYDPPAIEAELARIQAEIDALAFDLYGFSAVDRTAAQAQPAAEGEPVEDTDANEDDEENDAAPVDATAALLSWAVGVAFGRFDWRLATGERAAPPSLTPSTRCPRKAPACCRRTQHPSMPTPASWWTTPAIRTIWRVWWKRYSPASRSTCRPMCAAGCNASFSPCTSSAIPRAAAKRPSTGRFPPLRAATRCGSITRALLARRSTPRSTTLSSPSSNKSALK
jgi:hypothetical protein